MVTQTTDIERLGQAELRTLVGCLYENVLIRALRVNNERGSIVRRKIQITATADQSDAVQFGKPDINEGDIRMMLRNHHQRLLAVGCFQYILVTCSG